MYAYLNVCSFSKMEETVSHASDQLNKRIEKLKKQTESLLNQIDKEKEHGYVHVYSYVYAYKWHTFYAYETKYYCTYT